MKRLLFAILFSCSSLWVAAADSVLLGIGSPWPGLTLNDQHDKPARLVSPPLQLVVFAAERKPGDWAQEVIEKAHLAAVKDGRMALVLDIHRMPSLVTSMFAMPSFRARPFPILLAREGPQVSAVAFLPHKEATVTVISLTEGKVGAIEQAADEASLSQLLAKLSPTSKKDAP